MASTISEDEANLPVPVNRCESNVLSAMRNISTPCNNLKEQDLVAFLHDVLLPLVAWQNLLVQRQRGTRLELIKRGEQLADGLSLGALHCFIIELNLHVAPHIPGSLRRDATRGSATGWFCRQTGAAHRSAYRYRSAA